MLIAYVCINFSKSELKMNGSIQLILLVDEPLFTLDFIKGCQISRHPLMGLLGIMRVGGIPIGCATIS